MLGGTLSSEFVKAEGTQFSQWYIFSGDVELWAECVHFSDKIYFPNRLWGKKTINKKQEWKSMNIYQKKRHIKEEVNLSLTFVMMAEVADKSW